MSEERLLLAGGLAELGLELATECSKVWDQEGVPPQQRKEYCFAIIAKVKQMFGDILCQEQRNSALRIEHSLGLDLVETIAEEIIPVLPEQVTPEPVITQEIAPEPVIEEIVPEPVIEEIVPEPVLPEEIVPVPIEEIVPEPAEDIVPEPEEIAPEIEEIVPEPEETVPEIDEIVPEPEEEEPYLTGDEDPDLALAKYVAPKLPYQDQDIPDLHHHVEHVTYSNTNLETNLNSPYLSSAFGFIDKQSHAGVHVKPSESKRRLKMQFFLYMIPEDLETLLNYKVKEGDLVIANVFEPHEGHREYLENEKPHVNKTYDNVVVERGVSYISAYFVVTKCTTQLMYVRTLRGQRCHHETYMKVIMKVGDYEEPYDFNRLVKNCVVRIRVVASKKFPATL